jgi:RNA polymerase sigma factor FliA
MSIMRNPKASRQALQAYNQHSLTSNEEKNPQSQEDVFVAYRPKIVAIARRLFSRLSNSSSLEIDDLVSAGGMGLLEALERYDASRDNRFSTFAEYRIRGSMLDLIRSYDHVSRYRRDQAKELQQASNTFFQQTGREATSQDLEELTGLNQEKIAQVRLDSVSNPLISMEQDSSEERSLLEVLHDDTESNALDVLLDDELRMQIEIAIENLTERERQCVLLYYGRNMNLQEISAVFDLTSARISQLLSLARKKLKGEIIQYQRGTTFDTNPNQNEK